MAAPWPFPFPPGASGTTANMNGSGVGSGDNALRQTPHHALEMAALISAANQQRAVAAVMASAADWSSSSGGVGANANPLMFNRLLAGNSAAVNGNGHSDPLGFLSGSGNSGLDSQPAAGGQHSNSSFNGSTKHESINHTTKHSLAHNSHSSHSNGLHHHTVHGSGSIRPDRPTIRRRRARGIPTRPRCPECNKEFSNQSALSKHKLTHSDERKFVCDQCSKAFKRQDHLKGHMLTHRQEKPFKCEVEGCEKSYCDARSLRRHRENHHTPGSSLSRDPILGGGGSDDNSNASHTNSISTSGLNMVPVSKHTGNEHSLTESKYSIHLPTNGPHVLAGSRQHLGGVGHQTQPPRLLSALLNSNTSNLNGDLPPVNGVHSSLHHLSHSSHHNQLTHNGSSIPTTHHTTAHTQDQNSMPNTSARMNMQNGHHHYSTPEEIIARKQFNPSGGVKSGNQNIRFDFDPSRVNNMHINRSISAHQPALSPITPVSAQIDVVNNTPTLPPTPHNVPVSAHGNELSVDGGGGDFRYPRTRTQSISSLQNSPMTPTPNQASTPHHTSNGNHFQFDDQHVNGVVQSNGGFGPSSSNGYDSLNTESIALNPQMAPNTPTTNVRLAFQALSTGHVNNNGIHHGYQSAPSTPAGIGTHCGQTHFSYQGHSPTSASSSMVVNPRSQPTSPNLSAIGHNGNSVHFQFPDSASVSHTTNGYSSYSDQMSQTTNHCYTPHTPHTPYTPHTPHTPCGSAADPSHQAHFTFDSTQPDPFFAYDETHGHIFDATGYGHHGDVDSSSNFQEDEQVVDLILQLTNVNDSTHKTGTVSSLKKDQTSTSLPDKSASTQSNPTADVSSTVSSTGPSQAACNSNNQDHKQNSERKFHSANQVNNVRNPLQPVNQSINVSSSMIPPSTISQDRTTSVIQVAPSGKPKAQSQSASNHSFVAPNNPVNSRHLIGRLPVSAHNSHQLNSLGAKRKLKPRPEPIYIPPHVNSSHALQSHLRSPIQPRSIQQGINSKVVTFDSPLSNHLKRKVSPPPYTPPPILSPRRKGPGLFWPNFIANLNQLQAIHAASTGSVVAANANQSDVQSENVAGNSGSIPMETPKTAYEPQVFFDVPHTDVEPHVNIGPQFQARIPALIPERERRVRLAESRSKEILMWDPKCLDEHFNSELVDNFIQLSRTVAVHRKGSNTELALHLLHFSRGNVERALQLLLDMKPVLPEKHPLLDYSYSETSEWSQAEIRTFQIALSQHDKDFFSISKEMKTKTTKECVEFYFLWKKANSSDYKKWKNGTYRPDIQEAFFVPFPNSTAASSINQHSISKTVSNPENIEQASDSGETDDTQENDTNNNSTTRMSTSTEMSDPPFKSSTFLSCSSKPPISNHASQLSMPKAVSTG